MSRAILPAALVGALALGGAHPAHAHAVCGSRVFPVTLTIDDPGVADEASLPTFSWQRSGADGGPGPVNSYDFNFEYDKRITTNLGLAINDGFTVQNIANDRTRAGLQNLVLTLKYAGCVSPEHEFQLGAGVQREFGWTGKLATGADAYGATAPTLYFGKGLGDLPIGPLRALAITGEFSYTVADRKLKLTSAVDPDTGDVSQLSNNGSANSWFGGVSIQYSFPYLQSQVKDYGLPSLIGRLTPLMEVTWSSPSGTPGAGVGGAAWTIAPGVLYSGDWYQFGIEALIPANRTAGTNVGVIAQFHVFLDDIFPNTLGKPIVEWFR